MAGDGDALGDDLDLAGADQRLDAAADQLDRDRVAILADRGQRLGVDPHARALAAIEALGRQPPQRSALGREQLADGALAADDPAIEVGLAGRPQDRVELGQALHLRHRDQVVSAKAADLTLDAALLVGTADAGLAEERSEQVVGAQRDEAVGLDPAAALEDPDDRRLEVVEADLGGDAAEELEAVGVAFEEGLLGLALEGLDPGGAGVGEADHEQVDFDQLSGDPDLRLAPVDLCLRARIVGLGDVALRAQAERPATGGDGRRRGGGPGVRRR